jgi:pyrroloquinoline quinone (PQQ) biosynthesis protein C
MTFYSRLKSETIDEKARLYAMPIIQKALNGGISKDEYIAFLTEAYHHVKHTVPLLMACGSYLKDDYEWVKKSIAEYVEEEYGHEKWILNDIKSAGGSIEDAIASKPNISTDTMVAYAYHQIDRNNPIGFLGMVFVLEGTSVELATEAANVISKSLQLPDQAFSYLLSHGSLDIEHIKFYENMINQLSKNEDQQCVIHCAKSFYHLYANIFQSIPKIACKKNEVTL